MDNRVNEFTVDTDVTVRIEYEDVQDIKQNHPKIDGSVFLSDENRYPVTATGAIDSTGTWLFYKTGSGTAQLEYDEFIKAFYETMDDDDSN
jgi:hypothetical protein